MRKKLLFIMLLFSVLAARATTYYSIASGGWTSSSTWSLSSGGSAISSGYPGAGDDVIIEGGFTVTIAAGAVENLSAANVTIGSTTNGTLSYPVSNTGSSLTLTGDLTIGGSSGSGTLSYSNWGLMITCARLLKGAGTATRTTPDQQDFTFTGTFTLPADNQFNSFRNFVVNGGTVTLSANISTNGSNSPYIYAGSTLDLQTYTMTIGGYQNFNIYGTLIVGGNSGGFGSSNFPNTFTTLVIGNSSTVTYSYAGNQTVYPATYNNLTVSGSGIKSIGVGYIVASLTLNNGGSNYFCGANLNFSGGGGSGAAGTATVNFSSHVISSVALTNGGSGYTSAPSVSVSGTCGGSGASVTANISLPTYIVNGTLTINNSASLTVTASGILTTNSTVTNNGTLTVASGGSLKNSSAISNVTLQETVIAQRGWRGFANPFSTATTIASVASTNGITIGTSVPSSGLTDSRTFSSNTWANVTGSTWSANTPYALFIRGLTSEVTGSSYSGGPTAFTYSVSGTLNGNSTSIIPANTSDFILVGNPYAAPVTTQSLTGQNAAPYYTYQITVTGTPQVKAGSWVASGGNSSTSKTIPVLGVVAYQPASTSTFNITTADINTSGTLQTSLFGVDPVASQLELLVEQNGVYQDKLFVRLDNKSTVAGTDRIDLQKFYNDNVNVYTIADATRLAIDARNVLSTIPLGISALAGDYNFKLNSNQLPDGTTVYLKDKLLNTQTELKTGDTYNFSISADAASSGEQRFELVFNAKKNNAAAIDNGTGSLTARVLGNITSSNLVAVEISGSSGHVNIAIKDMNGRSIGNVAAVNGIQYIHLGNAGKGMLLLQVSDEKSTVIQKLIKL